MTIRSSLLRSCGLPSVLVFAVASTGCGVPVSDAVVEGALEPEPAGGGEPWVPGTPPEAPSSEPVASGPVDVSVSFEPSQRFQTLAGFGASVVFYVDWLSRHPNREAIYEVVFRDLGLDILRLGNWYQESIVHADSLEVVRGARASMGELPRILMSSWSPPAVLKSNGQLNDGGTLARVNGQYAYAEFGDWWLDTVNAYAAAGVPVDYVSLQNEPDFTAGWESCRFGAFEGQNAGYGEAFAAVAERLATLDAAPALLGPEVLGANSRQLGAYLGNIDSNRLGGVAHHLYSGGDPNQPDTYIDAMNELSTAAAGKPIFMTEFAPEAEGPEFFNTAWLIHNALTVEGVSAYLYWALTWRPPNPEEPAATGLVTTESPLEGAPPFETAHGFTVNRVYYALKHYARWLDPGWQRIGATSSDDAVRVSAFVSPGEDQVTLVALNTGAQAHTLGISSEGFDASSSSAFRTAGESERTAALGPLATGGAVTLPPRSVVTVVFDAARY